MNMAIDAYPEKMCMDKTAFPPPVRWSEQKFSRPAEGRECGIYLRLRRHFGHRV